MSQAGVRSLHVLVLGKPDWGDDVPTWAGADARIEQVATFEEALEAPAEAAPETEIPES